MGLYELLALEMTGEKIDHVAVVDDLSLRRYLFHHIKSVVIPFPLEE